MWTDEGYGLPAKQSYHPYAEGYVPNALDRFLFGEKAPEGWVPIVTPPNRARDEALVEAAGNAGVGPMSQEEFEAMLDALPDDVINKNKAEAPDPGNFGDALEILNSVDPRDRADAYGNTEGEWYSDVAGVLAQEEGVEPYGDQDYRLQKPIHGTLRTPKGEWVPLRPGTSSSAMRFRRYERPEPLPAQEEVIEVNPFVPSESAGERLNQVLSEIKKYTSEEPVVVPERWTLNSFETRGGPDTSNFDRRMSGEFDGPPLPLTLRGV
jgi:hypothetical protein